MSNGKKIVRLVFITLFILSPLAVLAQGIVVKADRMPVNSVLIGLRNEYGVQLSFNDKLLSDHSITADTSFASSDEALRFILAGLPFDFTKSGDVYIIYPITRQKEIVKYIITGQVRDHLSKESLPFSHIRFDEEWIVSDFLGQFSIQTLKPPPYNLTVSYLGYYILDTTIYSGRSILLNLIPSNISITEVLIKGMVIEKSVQSGRNSGEIRINHQIAQFLPGNGDNSVFNLLRLQPGIVAAGELANDLIIWGSYEGQSRVLFDGFTIFGLKNYNDNISAVNPFMAKDIRVLKGGYGAEYGGRVGGVVDITGVEGARDSPDVKVTLNNLTLNGYLSVPVGQRSSFVMAFRQTYYDLYDSESLSILSGRGNNSQNQSREVDLNVFPDYLFRDVNLKLSGELAGGDNWHISLFTGSDRFSYEAEDNTLTHNIYSSSEERNIQNGGSLLYNKRWKGGSTTTGSASYSGFLSNVYDIREVTRLSNNRVVSSYDRRFETLLGEYSARIDHIQPLPGNHSLKFGGGIVYDEILFNEDTFDIELINSFDNAPIVYGNFTDIIHLGSRVLLRPGLRADFPVNLAQTYLQPRISISVEATDFLRINASSGRYNQFMALSSTVDESGNYRFRWTLADNDEVPVLSSNHYVAGISYSKSDFQFSIEGFYKATTGITRFVSLNSIRDVYQGKSRSRGLDFFVKKEFGGHTFWVSYSLSKTEEYYPYFLIDEYRSALHDQRHEVKLAGIIDLEPFFLSGNWVYGSGFESPFPLIDSDLYGKPYNRVDISAVYRLSKSRFLFDAGVSLLNLFDTENIKYSNFTRIPLSQSAPLSIHAEAVPRTLTLFINFSF